MKSRNSILFILILLLAGCTQNITLELPDYQPKVGVFCILKPDTQPKMYLNLSKSYFDYADPFKDYGFIKTAHVTITDQTANTIDTLKLDSGVEPGYSTMTWYYLGKIKPVSGHHYVTEITYNTQHINAETTVPFPVGPDHYNYEKIKDSTSFNTRYVFHIFVNDRPNEDNSYELTAYPPQSFGPNEKYNYYSDLGLDGKQLELQYEYQDFTQLDSFSVGFTFDDATRATDKYITDLFNQQNTLQDPFTEPVILESNINGGLGLFGASATSEIFYIKVK